MDFLPAFHKTPEFLRSTGYQNPENPVNGPFQFAYQTSVSVWDWLAMNPGPLDRFNTYMEGSRANSPHWADYFPVQERLLNGVGIEGRPLLVDIGGGRGQDLLGFKSRFPRQSGRLILEELPSVIDDIKDLDGDIETLRHDFFSRQPVKGTIYSLCILPSPLLIPMPRRTSILLQANYARLVRRTLPVYLGANSRFYGQGLFQSLD